MPALGDLNGDGIVDLAVPSVGSKSISVLLGNPDGSFQAPQSVDAGASPFAVVVADFNGDGVKDIAAATLSGISIILGEGGGNFSVPVIVPAGESPERIIAADFNGDHIPDLAVANFISNDVSVFLGKGDGTFTQSGTIAVGMGPLGLAAADLNGDGQTDLVVSNSGISSGSNQGPNGNTIAVLLGAGNGTFGAAEFLTVKHRPEGIAIGDFNKDGKPDLVVALNTTDQVAELLGNGDGTFQTARAFTVFPQSTPAGVGGGPTNVALADFNGDGNVDLAVANSLTSTVGVLTGDGTGNFKSSRNIEVSRTPVWVLTGDYNRDGNADFISSNSDASTVSVVLGLGDGTFLDGSHFAAGARPQNMVVADFNDDGVPDVATVSLQANGPQSASVLLGKRGGGFAPENVIALNGSIVGLAAADLNQDGHVDLLATNFGIPGSDPGGISVLLGKGDGTFQPATNLPAGSNPIVIAVADFNGDGKPDVIVSNRVFASKTIDSLVLLPGDGRGGFGTPSNIVSFPPFDTVNFLLTADFNGDGKADIAYVDVGTVTNLSIRLGNGDGTFQPAKVVTSVSVNSAIFAVSIGDLNNDGSSDFAVEEGGVIEVLLGNGHGNFVSKGKFPESDPSVFEFVPALLLADFDGDGLLDVAATDGFSDNVAVLLGNGDGTLGAPTLFGGGHTAAAVAADFNGDGRPDIALATTAPTASPNSPGEVILLLNTTHK